jgi:hypothetical protein
MLGEDVSWTDEWRDWGRGIGYKIGAMFFTISLRMAMLGERGRAGNSVTRCRAECLWRWGRNTRVKRSVRNESSFSPVDSLFSFAFGLW